MRKGKDENVDPRGQAFFLCGFEGAKLSVKTTPAQHNISGDNSLRVPPVPIPNTEVKPQHADGTWLATARESRSSPDSILFGQSSDCPFFDLSDVCVRILLFLCIGAMLACAKPISMI